MSVSCFEIFDYDIVFSRKSAEIISERYALSEKENAGMASIATNMW